MGSLSYQDAVAQLTAAGAPFEIVEQDVRGQQLNVFANAPATLPDLFDGARRPKRRDRTFLVYEDEQWTFGDVIDAADALSVALVDRFGVRPGDRVAIGMRNYPEWIVSFVGVLQTGAVAALLNAWWGPDELAHGLSLTGASLVIADRERAERLARLDPADRPPVIVARDGGDAHGFERWEDVVKPDARAVERPPIDTDDDATILFTSGTTGKPKGAVSTHRAVLQALTGFGCRAAVDRLVTASRAEERGAEQEDHGPSYPPAFILAIPLFHVTGLVPVMLGTFSAGLKLVMMHKWEPRRALELIERERITNFVGVPTMAWDLVECPDFEKYDTSSLVAVGGGGSAAPPELVRKVENSFRRGRPTIGYGMTETNAYGPQNSGDDYLSRPTSSGRATPILDVKVIDPDGEDLPAGEQGEICFRGPNLIRGYWADPEATSATFTDDGWLRSGDIGRIDHEGFVYVEDRAKDIVIRGGENVSCTEVEAVLYEHPSVYEATVFGVPHERLGEEVAAAVVPKPGHDLAAEELQGFAAERLAAFKVPARIEIWPDQLPRNASGKILRRVVRDEVVERAST